MSAPAPGFAVWLTGIPSSGKTTLAQAVAPALAARGIHTQLLDSDELRRQLTPEPTYTPAERAWFYATLAWLATLLTTNGVNVLIAATAPRRAYRDAAREQIARFAEVWVRCKLESCQTRDPKGLWAKAARGEIDSLPGAGAVYERPLAPELILDTDRLTVAEAAARLVEQLHTRRFL